MSRLFKTLKITITYRHVILFCSLGFRISNYRKHSDQASHYFSVKHGINDSFSLFIHKKKMLVFYDCCFGEFGKPNASVPKRSLLRTCTLYIDLQVGNMSTSKWAWVEICGTRMRSSCWWCNSCRRPISCLRGWSIWKWKQKKYTGAFALVSGDRRVFRRLMAGMLRTVAGVGWCGSWPPKQAGAGSRVYVICEQVWWHVAVDHAAPTQKATWLTHGVFSCYCCCC